MHRSGTCDALQSLSAEDFYDTYLSGLQSYHTGPGSRSPMGLTGGKVAQDPRAHLSGSSFSLYRLSHAHQGLTTDLVSCSEFSFESITFR